MDGKLLVGRCSCGVIGCGDITVDITTERETVFWLTVNEHKFIFEKGGYNRTIEAARTDFSWEDLNRKVERHVSEIFKNTSYFRNCFPFVPVSQKTSPIFLSIIIAKVAVRHLNYSLGL